MFMSHRNGSPLRCMRISSALFYIMYIPGAINIHWFTSLCIFVSFCWLLGIVLDDFRSGLSRRLSLFQQISFLRAKTLVLWRAADQIGLKLKTWPKSPRLFHRHYTVSFVKVGRQVGQIKIKKMEKLRSGGAWIRSFSSAEICTAILSLQKVFEDVFVGGRGWLICRSNASVNSSCAHPPPGLTPGH